MKYVLANLKMLNSGEIIDDVYYGGVNKKYGDMIQIVPNESSAYKFHDVEEAQRTAYS